MMCSTTFPSQCSARYACRLSSALPLKPSARNMLRRSIPRPTSSSASLISRNNGGDICSIKKERREAAIIH
uniref:Uncharacterized protein n=1 Tax=Oryza brachyantha TaxID=4533 RepID=J3KZA8_ORYBR